METKVKIIESVAWQKEKEATEETKKHDTGNGKEIFFIWGDTVSFWGTGPDVEKYMKAGAINEGTDAIQWYLWPEKKSYYLDIRCLCAKLLQLCPTLWDPMDCSPLGSSIPGILQVRILEWVAILFSRGSSWSRDWTCISCGSCIIGRFSIAEPPGKPWSTGSSKKQESSEKTSISALLTMPKPLTVWITINCGKFWKRQEYQTTWPTSWETCVQVRKQQLKLDMEQQTGSK